MSVNAALSISEITEQFCAAMHDAVVPYGGPIEADGELHRFHVEGDKPRSKNGWYRLHSDGIPAGTFGTWKHGADNFHKFTADIGRVLSKVEKRENHERIAKFEREREIERRKRQQKAAKTAREMLESSQPASADHPYLKRKGVGPNGIRQKGGKLLIPIATVDGNVTGLQTIDDDGTKYFTTGMAKRGNLHPIGDLDDGDTLYICEGFATGATIHEATGKPVIVAFDGGSLEPVAKNLHAKYPNKQIVICADNDLATDENRGVKYAKKAAAAVGARVAIPEFTEDESGSDFNDLAAARGLDAVRDAINSASLEERPAIANRNGERGNENGNNTASTFVSDILTSRTGATDLAAKFGGSLYHCGGDGWRCWTGSHFKPSQKAALACVGAVAKDVRKKRAEIISTDGSEKLADLLKAYVRKLEDGNGAKHVLAHAESLPELDGDRIVWDAHENLLNCSNVTVDLRKGAARPHSRGDYITKCSPLEYRPDAPREGWLKFLQEIFPDEAERTFIKRAIGYAFTGSTKLHKLFIAYGCGANGKSTFLNSIAGALGPAYSAQADPRSFMEGDGKRFDLARLQGVRFVNAVETSEGHSLDEALVKSATSGDPIIAERKYHDPFEFIPEWTVWLCTNHKPRIKGTDHAIWRRICLVPFTVTIPEDQRDNELPKKLAAEAEGILAWAVQGAVEFLRDGLNPPASVVEATDDYRKSEDIIGQFITEAMVVEPNGECTKKEFYKAYSDWAERQGERPLSQRKVSPYLQELGLDAYLATGGTHTWIGIRLKTVEELEKELAADSKHEAA